MSSKPPSQVPPWPLATVECQLSRPKANDELSVGHGSPGEPSGYLAVGCLRWAPLRGEWWFVLKGGPRSAHTLPKVPCDAALGGPGIS